MSKLKSFLILGLITFSLSTYAGNYVKTIFHTNNHDVSGFQFYKDEQLSTNLPRRIHLKSNQKVGFEFNDISIKQDNYIIIRFTNKDGTVYICDIEIMPANFNRKNSSTILPKVIVNNFPNDEARYCEFTQTGREYLVTIN